VAVEGGQRVDLVPQRLGGDLETKRGHALDLSGQWKRVSVLLDGHGDGEAARVATSRHHPLLCQCRLEMAATTALVGLVFVDLDAVGTLDDVDLFAVLCPSPPSLQCSTTLHAVGACGQQVQLLFANQTRLRRGAMSALPWLGWNAGLGPTRRIGRSLVRLPGSRVVGIAVGRRRLARRALVVVTKATESLRLRAKALTIGFVETLLNAVELPLEDLLFRAVGRCGQLATQLLELQVTLPIHELLDLQFAL
jgi:hypothetical protein